MCDGEKFELKGGEKKKKMRFEPLKYKIKYNHIKKPISHKFELFLKTKILTIVAKVCWSLSLSLLVFGYIIEVGLNKI